VVGEPSSARLGSARQLTPHQLTQCDMNRYRSADRLRLVRRPYSCRVMLDQCRHRATIALHNQRPNDPQAPYSFVAAVAKPTIDAEPTASEFTTVSSYDRPDPPAPTSTRRRLDSNRSMTSK
jgi:hypothetical protein